MLFNGQEIKNFDENEFPEGELEFASSEIILTMDKLRDMTKIPIYPSVMKGALARTDDEKSQHYASLDKSVLSKAMDWFPGRGESVSRLFLMILGIGMFGGIGIYFDTNGFVHSNKIMFHTDLRKIGKNEFPTIWLRINGNYLYPLADKTKINTLMNYLRKADENF